MVWHRWYVWIFLCHRWYVWIFIACVKFLWHRMCESLWNRRYVWIWIPMTEIDTNVSISLTCVNLYEIDDMCESLWHRMCESLWHIICEYLWHVWISMKFYDKRCVNLYGTDESLWHTRFENLYNIDHMRGGGLGSRPIFKKFHETYAPS